MLIAAMVGSCRQSENLQVGRRDAHGAPRDGGWQIHIEGAAGELAVAKWRGAYWNGNLGKLKASDVGKYEVRTTSGQNNRLIIHDDDADNRAFILVIGQTPKFWLRGWIWGREGKRPEYWCDPVGGRAAFFVPQRALRPILHRPLKEQCYDKQSKA